MRHENEPAADPVTRRRLLLAAGGTLGLAGVAGLWNATAGAQSDEGGAAPASLGTGFSNATSGRQYLMLGYADFDERTDARRSYRNDGLFTGSDGDRHYVAPIHLPGGAEITAVEALVQVPLTGSAISVVLTSTTPQGGTTDVVSGTATPSNSDTRIQLPLDPAVVVDPSTTAYAVVVRSAADENSIYGVRVEYRGPAGLRLVTQRRVVDSRESSNRYSGGERRISLASLVPAGTVAALVNLTVTDTGNTGFLGLFPSDVPYPGTSSINWFTRGETVANTTVVALGPDRAFKVRGSGDTHYVIDLIGLVG